MFQQSAAAAQARSRTVPVAADKVLATHYFTPYPLSYRGSAGGFTPAADTGSFYDTGYLSPSGEGGAHAAYYSKLRDRPPAADVLTTGTTEAQAFAYDQQVEIGRIKAAGFNATFVDLLDMADSTTRNYRLVHHHLDAAHAVDPAFRVVAMPDMTGGVVTGTAFTNAVAAFAAKPASWHLPDGRLVVVVYTPETGSGSTYPPSYFQSRATELAALGVTVAWVWCFQAYETYVDAYTAVANTYGLSNWGGRNPAFAVSERSRAVDATSRGLKWFGPIAHQDQRPPFGIYDEANGSQLLREFWITARQVNAAGIQAITWNDYSESTQFSPSRDMGSPNGWAEMNRLYMRWFTDGVAPTVSSDFACILHRRHHTSNLDSYGQTLRMSLRAFSTATVNLVEVFTWLTAPATVTATIGGVAQTPYTAPAGENVHTFAITTSTAGAPSVTVVRSGTTTVNLTSRHTITTTPVYQDFGYYATCNTLTIA